MDEYPMSPLQKMRQDYKPGLPSLLKQPSLLRIKQEESEVKIEEGIEKIFPHTIYQKSIFFELLSNANFINQPLKVGICFSGGQAPGGHNVIAGLFDVLKQLHSESSLYGFLNGPEGLIKGECSLLDEEKISHYRNQGGFDLIGSGRKKIETLEEFQAIESTLDRLGLSGLVIIGGDDSNTNAAFLAEYLKKQKKATCIVGVPKTIDGDLRNESIEVSFGYDTACKVYAELIGNLAKDALSAKKYYFFVKLMGRSASHIVLECAMKTQINLALIGEEISSLNLNLKQVVDQIADLICLRAKSGKNYGVILIPEGVIEFIEEFQILIKELNHLLVDNKNPETVLSLKNLLSQKAKNCLEALPENFQQQMFLERDSHGNIQVSKIETERLLIALVEQELICRQKANKYEGKFNAQPLFFGYEGRSALPTNFDCCYCYSLGYLAGILISHKKTGYMACLKNLGLSSLEWVPCGIPLASMLHFEERKGKKQAVIEKKLVDLSSKIFKLYCQKREKWLLEDLYLTPGPIQYLGPTDIVDVGPLLLQL